jgi:hypothetical protein
MSDTDILSRFQPSLHPRISDFTAADDDPWNLHGQVRQTGQYDGPHVAWVAVLDSDTADDHPSQDAS